MKFKLEDVKSLLVEIEDFIRLGRDYDDVLDELADFINHLKRYKFIGTKKEFIELLEDEDGDDIYLFSAHQHKQNVYDRWLNTIINHEKNNLNNKNFKKWLKECGLVDEFAEADERDKNHYYEEFADEIMENDIIYHNNQYLEELCQPLIDNLNHDKLYYHYSTIICLDNEPNGIIAAG